MGQLLLAEFESIGDGIGKGLERVAEIAKKKCPTVEECNEEEMEMAWDDVSGAELDPQEVQQARLK